MSRKAAIRELKTLPPAFTYSQAMAAGISAERLYAYRDQGHIDQIARGLYLWADSSELDQLRKQHVVVDSDSLCYRLSIALVAERLKAPDRKPGERMLHVSSNLTECSTSSGLSSAC